MFDRFLRFAEARRELARGQFEAALRLIDDPLVREHRRSRELEEKVLHGLRGRARARIERLDWSAALGDLDLVLRRAPEDEQARRLREDALEAMARQQRENGTAQLQVQEARRLVLAGQLEAARELLARAGNAAGEQPALHALIENRRTLAAARRAEAEAALGDGQAREAIRLLIEAQALDRDSPGAAADLRRLVTPLGGAVARSARLLAQADDLAAMRGLLVTAHQAAPDLATQKEFRAAALACHGELQRRVRAELVAGEFAAATELDRALTLDAIPGIVDMAWIETIEAARATGSLLEAGDLQGAAAAAQKLGEREQLADLRRRAEALAEDARWCEQMQTRARELAAQGDLLGARERLLDLLGRFPAHATARAEIALLDRGAETRARRLAEVRAAIGRGELHAAQAALLSLVVAGPEGDEPRLLLRDVQARIAVVAAGIDQVRRWMHGRDSGSREGLRHCAGRLEQLAGMQSDHAELDALKAAIDAEIEGHEQLGELQQAHAAADPGRFAEVAAALRALSPRLLAPDRLTSRCEQLLDQVLGQTQRSLAAGGLRTARRWLDAVALLVEGSPALRERHAELSADLARRIGRCEAHAAAGIAAVEARDFDRARQCLDEARACGDLGGDALERLAREVARTERQARELVEVERLAKEDTDAAGRRMQRLDPATPMLRTRIFDLKQGLARMQGLEHGFLLRVDECGEYLVLRGDAVSIGNLREGTADLPILANIAGRHARLVRSMSFHGGMQDRIEADRGAVAVNGTATGSQRLAHGDRVRLGPTLEFRYEVPSPRSLSAALTLARGFQCCGTDKILLLKDRGQDGRLLLGPAADAHVRHARATEEVELFASRDGQVRVACRSGGKIDGKPFRGEHPVLPGAFIEAGGLGFVVLPRPRA